MPNMKTVSQRNLKLLDGEEKTDGWTDKLIQVYPPYNFVVQGYKNIILWSKKRIEKNYLRPILSLI
jgi:hypothetical protein